MYLDRKEPICAMSYFCLTVIERKFGGRSQASHALLIDQKILSKLGELSSVKGDKSTARKAVHGKSEFSPLSDSEQRWIETAVKLLIRRIGEYSQSHELQKIEMRDLPPLNEDSSG
jgi:hypothetical protein